MKERGFTLVEIMIVVAIIGLLAAIAIPNFIKARKDAMQNACIQNLQQIEGAKQEWAFKQRKSGTDSPVWANLTAYLKGNKTPLCPGGGTYTINVVDSDITCSISSHVLQ